MRRAAPGWTEAQTRPVARDLRLNGERMTMPLILVVDPDADSRTILRSFLQHAGWEVAQAECGAGAVAAARRLGPAVVIGEHPVPMEDGVALCDALRGDPATAHIPFVAVTSRVTAAEMADACRGHCRVIAKPADFAAVVCAVAELLGGDDS
jgi:CheY-like chemotaxis protein